MSKNSEDDRKHTDVDNVLGRFGRYQVCQFALALLPVLLITMVKLSSRIEPEDRNYEYMYRCFIMKCEEDPPTYAAPWYPTFMVDRCARPILKADHVPVSKCTQDSFEAAYEICEEWISKTHDTLSAEILDWIKFGRKAVLIVYVAMCGVEQLKTLAITYNMYQAITFFEQFVPAGSYTTAMVIMFEICGSKHRATVRVAFAAFTYLGDFLYNSIALAEPYWRTFLFILNAPFLFSIICLFFIKESPRWQIINGKTEGAKKTMLLAAKMNNIDVNREELEKMDEAQLKDKFKVGAYEKRDGFIAIVTSGAIVKSWLVIAMCLYTSNFIQIYFHKELSQVLLFDNDYVQVLLPTLMPLAGELIALCMMNVGRKQLLMFEYIVFGLLCLAMKYVFSTFSRSEIPLYVATATIKAATDTTAITYIMELAPTSARGTLLGLALAAGQLGTVTILLVYKLPAINNSIPWILFVCCTVLSALLCTLRDTKDIPLMDTVRQVEDNVRAAADKRRDGNSPPVDSSA